VPRDRGVRVLTAPRRVKAAWGQTTARVLRQTDAGAGHRWLDLELPGSFAAPAPGQFVQLLLRPLASPVLLPRPMSVAAVAGDGRRRTLGFLYAPIGAGTRALAALDAGDDVDVLGPLGHGFRLEDPGTPVLVAGGRGVAPLLFAADALARAGRRCEFIFGARSQAQLVGLAGARERLAKMGGRLHLCTDDGSAGTRGHAVARLAALAPTLEGPLVIHACGPHGMLKAIARWGLREGVPCWLAMESIMACGTGVCRGCPLPRSPRARATHRSDVTPSLWGNAEWAMCCTEGPVFEAAALDWDRIE
jgi:dihydroorotate dehydrogenase electron transfer subunit